MYYTIQRNRDRGVAQFGRALRSGRRGRGFESRRFDWNENAESLDNQELRHFFVCQKENRKKYLVTNLVTNFSDR